MVYEIYELYTMMFYYTSNAQILTLSLLLWYGCIYTGHGSQVHKHRRTTAASMLQAPIASTI